MKKKKKSNAGRKPIDDKKIRVVLFFNQSKIKEQGGEAKFKEYIYEKINNEIENK